MDSAPMRLLELLSPARDAETGRQAILHGADAVYIGGPMFGARQTADNSIDDIRGLVDFAHQFRAKVYVTVNTVIKDAELRGVEEMIWDLYRCGIDALIVQDLGILRLNLPPVPLHASTQCDTRTPEKAAFLEALGFSQIVLARELGLNEIRKICDSVSVPVEVFVHGALCVSYSGRCHTGQVWKSRSANRGACPQVCRLPFTLTDASGKVLAKDKYLLSLRDLNASSLIGALAEAGVSSFKIEGRLKDVDYVKNITAYYSKILDDQIAANPDKWRRASFGHCEYEFTPDPYKSFNRGFSTYFLSERKPRSIASILTPKSLGEPISDISSLAPGDGVSYFDHSGKYLGLQVNAIKNGNIIGRGGVKVSEGMTLHRTSNVMWDKTLKKSVATRRIGLSVAVSDTGVSATDDRGCHVRIPLDCSIEEARKPMNPRPVFEKLGATIYFLKEFTSTLSPSSFIPASALTSVRRRLCDALDQANTVTYKFELRKAENKEYKLQDEKLDYRDNVANRLAQSVYVDHGVKTIEKALECDNRHVPKGTVVMTCRHCVLRELGKCLKENAGHNPLLPLKMSSAGVSYRLRFNCDRCEMEVLTDYS